jgi:uncharacterized protein with NRDE domain
MCLILFAYNLHPQYSLILAANRDEFYSRPTVPANFWQDAPNILAGRDLVHGGTWLGITRTGRFAAITNYRDLSSPQGSRSRGKLVSDFLQSNISVSEYIQDIKEMASKYSAFNLLVGQFNEKQNTLCYFSNRSNTAFELSPGIYALSNHLLDTPWPKVESGKKALDKFISNTEELSSEQLFEILKDERQAKDDDLPNTGIGLERERVLSPLFIKTENYGTRCSTVLMIGKKGEVIFEESDYLINPDLPKRFHFRIESR